MGEVMKGRARQAEEAKGKKRGIIDKIEKLSQEGLTNAEIAAKCRIPEASVRYYKKNFKI